mmetsp:Transcript_28563/g.82372  ORF Transcript_28563/g.82372 Transcript_28563/m.82372 type:complete len:262 (-) Transcript_28563:1424-2209(-)
MSSHQSRRPSIHTHTHTCICQHTRTMRQTTQPLVRLVASVARFAGVLHAEKKLRGGRLQSTRPTRQDTARRGHRSHRSHHIRHSCSPQMPRSRRRPYGELPHRLPSPPLPNGQPARGAGEIVSHTARHTQSTLSRRHLTRRTRRRTTHMDIHRHKTTHPTPPHHNATHTYRQRDKTAHTHRKHEHTSAHPSCQPSAEVCEVRDDVHRRSEVGAHLHDAVDLVVPEVADQLRVDGGTRQVRQLGEGLLLKQIVKPGRPLPRT